jgi:hypothetical protein
MRGRRLFREKYNRGWRDVLNVYAGVAIRSFADSLRLDSAQSMVNQLSLFPEPVAIG